MPSYFLGTFTEYPFLNDSQYVQEDQEYTDRGYIFENKSIEPEEAGFQTAVVADFTVEEAFIQVPSGEDTNQNTSQRK